MTRNQPTVAGRGLGAELRSIREERKLSSTKVAKQLGWQQSKISKIETGKQSITPADVASLLAIYGVTGMERDRLVEKAETADQPGLLEKQSGVGRDSQTLGHLEAEAVEIVDVAMLLIPGLLQTPDYIWAVMKSGGITEPDIETRVATRLARQAILSRDNAPQVEFIIDEFALRRPLLPSVLMARQLRHVTETAERPNVTVRVLPSSAGGHRGVDGAFMCLTSRAHKTVVHLEQKISALFLEEPHEIDLYRQDVDSLRLAALAPAASLDFTSALLKDLDQEPGHQR